MFLIPDSSEVKLPWAVDCGCIEGTLKECKTFCPDESADVDGSDISSGTLSHRADTQRDGTIKNPFCSVSCPVVVDDVRPLNEDLCV